MSTLSTSQDLVLTPYPTPFTFILISCITCMGYDYLLTVRREISYIWSCPWSIGIALFYLSRYLMFIDQPLYLYLSVYFVAGSPNKCSVLLSLALVGMSLGFLSAQMIITLRTCAMWGRQRWVLVVLGSLTLVSSAFSIYTSVSEVIETTSANRISTPPGCKIHPLGKSFLAWFYLIIGSELVIVTLTMIKAYHHLQHSSSDWINQLYKNGIFYSICILLLGAINVLFIAVDVPPQYKHMFAFPARVLNSIFANRVMLLLAEHRHRTLQHNLRRGSTGQDFLTSTDMPVSFTTVGQDLELAGKDEANEPDMSEGEWLV